MAAGLDTPQTTVAVEAPRKRRLWRRIWIGLGITAFVLLIAYLSLWYYVSTMLASFAGPYEGRERTAFSKEAWDAAAHDWEGARFLMMDDLIAKHPMVGMQRQDVIDLLGPFHATDYPGFEFCYFLGPEDHPIALDNAWLVLTFENDVVTKWEVGTD